MSFPKDPTCEDDYPEDRIVTTSSFELEDENVSLNYIKEEGKEYFKLLNAQFENPKEK